MKSGAVLFVVSKSWCVCAYECVCVQALTRVRDAIREFMNQENLKKNLQNEKTVTRETIKILLILGSSILGPPEF